MKKTLLLALATISSVAVAEPPQQIDVKSLPGAAQVVEDVVIPVPSEIFNVLDRTGPRPAWGEVLRKMHGVVKTPPDRDHQALLLGTVIAEGFVAVEAEDAAEVKNIGNSVLSLSNALGVKRTIKARASAILDGADKKNWRAVKQELDKAQHEVQDAMREMNDQDYAQLVSLGGWLRGTEALTQVVTRSYSKDSAELLNQPVLVNYFDRRLTGMPKKIKDRPLVAKVQKGLTEIKPLMGTEGSAVSEKTVKAIGAITSDLNKAINVNAKANQ